MMKIMKIAVGTLTVLFITALIINPVFTQSRNKDLLGGKPISDDVMKIAKKSCIFCHTVPGNKMALSRVNLSNWDKYTPEKQAAKAKAICNMVTKGKMPPKKFIDKHPDSAPTKDEIKIICDWAQ
jgi:hypothetical protein